MKIFINAGFETEKDHKKLQEWIRTAFTIQFLDEKELENRLQILNQYFEYRSTILGNKIGVCDILLLSGIKRNENISLKFSNAISENEEFLNLKRWCNWIDNLLGVDWKRIMETVKRKEILNKKTKLKLNCSRELLKAVSNSEYEAVENLLKKGENIESVDLENCERTALHMAADKGDMKMITLLCKYKCLIDPLDKEKMTPLYYAIRQSNIEMCKFFLENGANLEHREIQERTPFYWAASLGEMSVIDYLIKKGANVNVTSSLGRSPLSKACWNGRTDVLERLLQCQSCDINSQDKNLRTPLHNAAWGSTGGRLGTKSSLNPTDSPYCTQRLLEHDSIIIDIADKSGNSALHIAASTNGCESLQLLIAFGGDINYLNCRNSTPLHKTCKRELLDCTLVLLENKCKLDVKDAKDLIPFHYLFCYHGHRLLKYLLYKCELDHVKQYIDANFCSIEYLHIGIDNYSYNCIELLLQYFQQIFMQKLKGPVYQKLFRRCLIMNSFQCAHVLLDFAQNYSLFISQNELELACYLKNERLFQRIFSLFQEQNPLIAIIPSRALKACIYSDNVDFATFLISKYTLLSEECGLLSDDLLEDSKEERNDWREEIGRINNVHHLNERETITLSDFKSIYTDFENNSELHLAISRENSNMIHTILAIQNINLISKSRVDGATPLILAVKNGIVLIVERILDKYKESVKNDWALIESFFQIKDNSELSAIDYCRIKGRNDMYELMKIYTQEQTSFIRLDYKILNKGTEEFEERKKSGVELQKNINHELEKSLKAKNAFLIPNFQYINIEEEFKKHNIAFNLEDNYLDSIIPHEKTVAIWVDNEDLLKQIGEDILNNYSIIGVDQEYFVLERGATITSLLQISTINSDYVIDALTLREVIYKYLNPVFTNPHIIKIFHGCDTDIQLLMTDFNIFCVNIFDTARAYNLSQKMQNSVKGIKSLYHIVQQILDVKLDKFFQVSDWRIRPLPNAMLNYARSDSHYLIFIYHILSHFLNEEKVWINPKALEDLNIQVTDLGKQTMNQFEESKATIKELNSPEKIEKEKKTLQEGNHLILLALHCNSIIIERIIKNHNKRVKLKLETKSS